MQNALPRLQKNIAIPLATLALGAAGGSALVAVLDEDNALTLPSASPAAESRPMPAQSLSPLQSRIATPRDHNTLGARP